MRIPYNVMDDDGRDGWYGGWWVDATMEHIVNTKEGMYEYMDVLNNRPGQGMRRRNAYKYSNNIMLNGGK